MRLGTTFNFIVILLILALGDGYFCKPAMAQDSSQDSSSKPYDPLKAVYANLDHLKAYAQGFALMQKGELREAEPLMSRILQFRPENPAAMQNYGFLLLRLGKFEEAIKILNRALQLDPGQVPAWGNLGGAYASLGKIDDAVSAYKKYIELSKNDPQIDVYKSMVTILEDQAKRQSAYPEESKDDYYIDAISFKGKMNWPLGKNPIRVYVEPGDGKQDYKPLYMDLLKKAFWEWSQASNDKIKFVFQNESGGAQIYCRWTDSTENLIARAEGGHAKVEYAGPVIGRSDITLLSISPCRAMPMNEQFAHRIYLHEIGHALGILGHSRNSNDSLFCGVNLSIVDGKLSDRDKKTLYLLYQNQLAPQVVSAEVKKRCEKNYGELVVFAEKAVNRGELEAADDLYGRALKQLLPFGFRDVRLATVLSRSGSLSLQMKKMLDAEITLRAAFNLMDSNDATDPEQFASCCKDLGNFYWQNKEKSEAKFYFERSLNLFKKLKRDAEVSELERSLKECL
ncbi:MAG: tetratricopeptide repeat protein [Cyanobacteria bacterium TGS_CYA1]|nr:tetratricopeptide repeat protein [Cyanobacteria bacterium TGS_CYA1]